jgi:exopolysaccharide production protein ExoZ
MDAAKIKNRSIVFVSLQGARALAALIVVFFHCQVVMSLPKYWNHSLSRYFLFGHSGVEVFFVLSGIVILHAHLNDIGKPARIASFFWKRFRRIYPVYWLFLLAILPVYLLIPSFGIGYERVPIVMLQSFLLVYLSRTETILPVAWTLCHEVMFYVVFASLLLNRKLGTILISLWIAASACALLVWSPPNLVALQYISPLHLLFGFGMVVLLLVRNISLPGWPLVLAGLAGFIACALYENHSGVEASFLLDVGYGIGAALVLCGAMFMELQGRLPIPRFLKLLGDASYAIYLAHYPAMSMLAKVFYPLWKRYPLPYIFPVVAMVATSTAIGVLIHLWIEKPVLRMLSKPRENKAQINKIAV